MRAAALWPQDALRWRRILCELGRWPDRPRLQIASAVGTAPRKPALDALPAKGALEGADHRVRGVRRQIFVAAFTVGP